MLNYLKSNGNLAITIIFVPSIILSGDLQEKQHVWKQNIMAVFGFVNHWNNDNRFISLTFKLAVHFPNKHHDNIQVDVI